MPEDKGLTRSEREEKVLKFWKDNKIFEKTLEKKSPKGEFVFYEGPPTANGRPGIHHIESRAFKDAIPRYKTMRGYHVPRKAGWDTHGLPVELQIEKKLGFKSKKDIEAYGVEKFNEECRESVFEYIDEWEKFTERIGYWVNLVDAYYTFDSSYIEAVWGVISKAEERKLLYKDYKVLPWCPRCGTALSSHELAQGYQEVKDLSLYVEFKVRGLENTSFVAWTTTPWTLPGNLALAVGPDITYVVLEKQDEGSGPLVRFIVAKERVEALFGTEGYKIIEEKKGKELVGLEYEPLYNFVTPTDKTFRIYPADFVTTTDGTGIVHTAVMYGQDDFELGTRVGLPKVHLVNPDGTFKSDLGWLSGRSVVDETLAVDILKDLKERGFLFDKENYTHSYPFCWRCKTRLIYYARDSWYIHMSELRDKLVKENEKINWEPSYIKEGRFGEWLREVKDWAISRERYWGTPLPVWVAEDGERIVVDSVEALKKYTKTNKNIFLFVRHGEAENNAKDIVNCDPKVLYHLTEKGRDEAKQAGKKIKRIDSMYISPYERTKETAEIISREAGFDFTKVIEDKRLSELNFGTLNGGAYSAFLKYEEEHMHTYDTPLPGGESYNDAKRRIADFVYDIDGKHKGETIVVVTHGMGLEAVAAAVEGAGLDRSKEIVDTFSPKPAEILKFDFVPLPHNHDFELDLHKPYIDDVVLMKGGKEYKRVKEVMDVWLDSGSVPFATHSGYPADFISEAVDQTRGWFYTLHAVGVLMEKGRAFKNVICLGHILDKEGKKMSKSVGNVVNPWEMIEKYGVDALRLWMYSVNQPGEPKNFDERTVEELNKRVFNLLDNVYAFYELYRDKGLESEDAKLSSGNILDKWVLVRLAETAEAMTKNLDEYKLLEPVRTLRDFIDDLSTWYLRRSRDRLKDGDTEAKQTLYYVLKSVGKLLAPFAPFYAEELFQKLRTENDRESVHLAEWPKAGKIDGKIITSMERTRRIVSQALEARSKANIKIRQPLASLKVKLDGAYSELIKDEVNVKEVKDADIDGVMLDTNLTPELIEEGKVRDIIRSIQEMRKEKNLKPSDVMDFVLPSDSTELYQKYKSDIEKTTNTVFVIE